MGLIYGTIRDYETGQHIGTIAVEKDGDPMPKIKAACEEHYNPDAGTMEVGVISIADFEYGRTHDLSIKYLADGDEMSALAEIAQTWLY
jgi:hypothetical protein